MYSLSTHINTPRIPKNHPTSPQIPRDHIISNLSKNFQARTPPKRLALGNDRCFRSSDTSTSPVSGRRLLRFRNQQKGGAAERIKENAKKRLRTVDQQVRWCFFGFKNINLNRFVELNRRYCFVMALVLVRCMLGASFPILEATVFQSTNSVTLEFIGPKFRWDTTC